VLVITVVLAGLALVCLIWWERREPAPLIPFAVLRRGQFLAANGYTFLVYASIGVFFLLLTLELEVVLGWRPLAAGAATIPVTVLTLLLSRPGGTLGSGNRAAAPDDRRPVAAPSPPS
jgi:hypothetical protein